MILQDLSKFEDQARKVNEEAEARAEAVNMTPIMKLFSL